MINQQGPAETEAALRLAMAFSGAVREQYPGATSIHEIVDGCTMLLVSYLTQTTPADRMTILSGLVDKLIAGIHDDSDADLEIGLFQ